MRFIRDYEEYVPPGICSLGGGSGGASGGTQTTQTVNNIPPELAPYLTDLFGLAQGAANITPASPYQGDLTAPVLPAQQQAAGSALNLAGQYPNLGASTIQLGQDTIAGNYLNPETNPYLSGVMSAQAQPLLDAFREQIAPAITSNAIEQGAYGGDRALIQSTQAARDLERVLADQFAKTAYTNYLNERNLQVQAPQLLGQGFNTSLLPINLQGSTGDLLRGWTQQGLDEQLAQYNMSVQAPWQPINMYSQAIQGLAPYAGANQTSTTTSNPAQPSTFGQALQGGLGGAAAGAAIGTATGGPIIGTGIGGLLGLLGGAL